MLLFNDDGQISTLVQFDMQVRRRGGGTTLAHTQCGCVLRFGGWEPRDTITNLATHMMPQGCRCRCCQQQSLHMTHVCIAGCQGMRSG